MANKMFMDNVKVAVEVINGRRIHPLVLIILFIVRNISVLNVFEFDFKYDPPRLVVTQLFKPFFYYSSKEDVTSCESSHD